jgi:quercetin dioxygenase-like cupin family protein
MIHLTADASQEKGWFVGPWNAPVSIPVGYAHAGVDERHYHREMVEICLVARGRSTAIVDGAPVTLTAGQILVVEPGEVHTFADSSDDYFHFVVQAPFVAGDKHAA